MVKVDLSGIAAFNEAREVAELTAMLLSGIVTGEEASRDLEETVEHAIEELSPKALNYYFVLEAHILRAHLDRG